MVRPPMITAELRKWQLSGSMIRGLIHNSREPDYKEGDDFTLLTIFSISHYPSGSDAEHWLVRSQTGRYFKIYASEALDVTLARTQLVEFGLD